MLASDVINRVRRSTGDQTSLQFTDADVLQWINDGIRECALQNNLLQKRATSSTVIGTNNYALPTDILKLHSVKYDNAKLRLLTLQEFDEYYAGIGVPASTDRGTPEICYIWAGNLTVYPAPDSVKNLVIDYTYNPGDIIATDPLPLPVGYETRIVDYCLAQVAQQDDDLERYQLKMEEFTTGVSGLKDNPQFADDLYPFMTVADRDTEVYYG